MTDSTFSAPLAMPAYRDHVLYQVIDAAGIPSVRAWQFNGWTTGGSRRACGRPSRASRTWSRAATATWT